MCLEILPYHASRGLLEPIKSPFELGNELWNGLRPINGFMTFPNKNAFVFTCLTKAIFLNKLHDCPWHKATEWCFYVSLSSLGMLLMILPESSLGLPLGVCCKMVNHQFQHKNLLHLLTIISIIILQRWCYHFFFPLGRYKDPLVLVEAA